MPIYEFACPKCRVNPERLPVCPKCGNKKMARQVSSFAMPRELKEPAAGAQGEDAMSALDESKMMKAMAELERDMGHLDENNPRHMAT